MDEMKTFYAVYEVVTFRVVPVKIRPRFDEGLPDEYREDEAVWDLAESCEDYDETLEEVITEEEFNSRNLTEWLVPNRVHVEE